MTKVPSDHFVNKFSGENRYEQACAHAAYLSNRLDEEKEKRRQLLEQTIEKLKEQNPAVALALELKEELDELNE